MLELGSGRSRALAIALSGVVLVGGYRLLVEPFLDVFESTVRSIEQSRTLLQKYRALAEQRLALTERLSMQQKRATTSASAYLEGPSDALAAAELLDLARSAIEATGGEVRSAEVLSAEPVMEIPWVRRISVRIQASLAIDGIASSLYSLEIGKPYVFIKELVVRADERNEVNRLSANSIPNVTLRLFSYVRETPAGTFTPAGGADAR